jgi:hypothetical protein
MFNEKEKSMDRRLFMKGASSIGALACIASGVTGCDDQTTIALLLGELSTAWQGFETGLGKALPANIIQLFTDAENSVRNWVPGTPAQDVVQVLQDLANAVADIEAVLPGITALEAAAASVILNTVVNIIEDIDPSAVPASASVSLTKLARKAVPPVAQKHFRQGEIRPSLLKKQFEIEWKGVTGKSPVA